ncbi:hypothetical protein AMATHDRAFT_72895 [Amanita thiersii Skay4041]|uniref:Aprataxin C2HE/C2H2/C2HC zinc finger domain-containing protein n=1 Tax=Amanita thiersii Skay4041 TaxID=703135 RepID=A0A2A9NV48_9AGAR|nr:hypothetical protein AMATHDRAFT_72895 [Amanita thiersii Skay4041]
MANLTILRTYAQKDPSRISESILFRHDEATITIFDAYPKSIFHFLVLPRVDASGPFTVTDLANLHSVIYKNKEDARKLIQKLKDASEALKVDIEAEMINRYGFKWDIWTGFHGSPSMVHLHLHVLSADMCSERMKNKKHYNSFHPELGFFLDIDTVLSWFDETSLPILPSPSYEKLLKTPLSCFHCGKETSNIPTLKRHLQEEWDMKATREKPK